MNDESSIDREALTREIRTSLQNTESNLARYRKTNSLLLITSIITAAATTLVTTLAAAGGLVIGNWKISCVVAAIFGFATTVCVGINQGLGYSQRLSRTNECAGRLKSLDVSIKTGRSNWENIAIEYEEIVKDFATEIRKA